MKHVSIYTDGACKGNPGIGGWGALLRFKEKEKKIKGAEELTTNNRMEVLAAIKALSILKEACKIDFYTDSQYLQKGVRDWLQGWKKNNWKKSDRKPVKNVDLWMRLDELIHAHHITWHWIKGHSGHVENDIADQLANDAINDLQGN